MTGVCVGPGFVVNGDGSLGLAGPRSGTWPYTGGSCTIGAANGFRLDSALGLWVEPPDLRAPFSVSNSNSTSLNLSATAQSLAVASTSIANPDTCRSAMISGAARVTFATSLGVGAVASVIGSAYQGTPPSSSGQPTLWSTQNNGAVTLPLTETITMPFSFTAAAGATTTIGFALWATGSGTATLNTISWTYAGVAMTTRSGW